MHVIISLLEIALEEYAEIHVTILKLKLHTKTVLKYMYYCITNNCSEC